MTIVFDYYTNNQRFHGVVGYHMCFTYTGSPVRTRVEPFLYTYRREDKRKRITITIRREDKRREEKRREEKRRGINKTYRSKCINRYINK